MRLTEDGVTKNTLIFDSWDCNDKDWDTIIKVLRDNLPDFEVLYLDGNNRKFAFVGLRFLDLIHYLCNCNNN